MPETVQSIRQQPLAVEQIMHARHASFLSEVPDISQEAAATLTLATVVEELRREVSALTALLNARDFHTDNGAPKKGKKGKK